MAKKNAIIATYIARAVIHERGGLEAAVEKCGPKAERLTKWTAPARESRPERLTACGAPPSTHAAERIVPSGITRYQGNRRRKESNHDPHLPTHGDRPGHATPMFLEG